MKKILNPFFNTFEGNWLTQTNIYILKNKKERIYNNKIKIDLINEYFSISNKLNISYKYNINDLLQINLDTTTFNFIKIKKKYNSHILKNSKLNIQLQLISENLLKIHTKINNENIIYQEYLYTINKNLKISLGILKKMNNYNYIGIVTRSYIKI